MGRKTSTTAAACALMICAVCHIWAVIELFRSSGAERTNSIHLTGSIPLVFVYGAAVVLFNWFAVSSRNEMYCKFALFSTGLHLICAMIQGAAGQALALSGVTDGGWISVIGIVIPAVVSLPFNSLSVMHDYGSTVPWMMAGFFALNLIALLLRARRQAGAN